LTSMGSVFTNKYAEGYPGKRYYGGCGPTDIVENIAIARAKQLFGAEHANVQPHSGSQANMAVYFAVLKPGDTIMGMDLSHGGHRRAGRHRESSISRSVRRLRHHDHAQNAPRTARRTDSLQGKICEGPRSRGFPGRAGRAAGAYRGRKGGGVQRSGNAGVQ